MKITSIEPYRIDRKKYEFTNRSVLLEDQDGKKRLYYCIVLEEKKTHTIVYYTGLERFVTALGGSSIISESTLRVAVSRVRSYLNYILWKTKLNYIHETTVNEIRGFLENAKVKQDGEIKKSDTWGRIIRDVFVFLNNYYIKNKDNLPFGYKTDDLYERKYSWYEDTPKERPKLMNVKPPKDNDHKHRNRAIMRGHLEALLYAAKKYDPMLHLVIILQAYGGLREGEIVCLSFSDLKPKKILGAIEKVVIELPKSNDDRYRRGKSHSGVIKKGRNQEIYQDFIDQVSDAIEFHKDYLEALGLPTEGNVPVFYNLQNKPISVTSLGNRMKKLFETFFIDILEKTSLNTPFDGETLAYVETYKEEYPGEHSLRGWFTNYLKSKGLRPEDIRKARGDSPKSSVYEDYLYWNDMFEEYEKSIYEFHFALAEEIYE